MAVGEDARPIIDIVHTEPRAFGVQVYTKMATVRHQELEACRDGERVKLKEE